MRGVTTFLSVMVLGAFGSWGAGAAPHPGPAFGVAVERDIVYGSAVNNRGESQALTLDLYTPQGDGDEPRPVIVWAHEGGFTGGTKDDAFISSLANRFGERGWVTASIEYRVRPVGTPGSPTVPDLILGSLAGSEPAPMLDAQHDMQAAVRWFRANAVLLRIDPAIVVAGGISAGANMALETAFNPDDPGSSGTPDERSDIAAAVSISGGSDLRRMELGLPPIAMFNGLQDTTAPYPAALETCAGVLLHLGVCELTTYTDSGHNLSAHEDDIVTATADFLCRHVVDCV